MFDSFLKNYKAIEMKVYFPYEWFDDFHSKLRLETLSIKR